MQSYGADEQSGSGRGVDAFPPVLLRNKLGGPASHIGVHHRFGDQSVVGDARPGLEERPHVLIKGKTRRRTRAQCS